MKLLSLAPLRAAVARPVPRLAMQTRAYASPWVGPEATESEADVRADNDTAVRGRPTAILQEETIDELHERTEAEDYNDAVASKLSKKGHKPTESQEAVRADRK
jgi:hypothetical protein